MQLLEFGANRPGCDYRYAIDCSKIEYELEWQSAESFYCGLAKMLQWYLENEAWCRCVQDGSCRRERSGSNAVT